MKYPCSYCEQDTNAIASAGGSCHGGGAVRVRPTGDTHRSARNR
ncbi:hypothetical protein [Spirilliplanes yamanashiensis]|nr:hypothetical protein [Spirilliplanes yamanashiensis]MDP9816656.1 hypothetical protein [Spirilliplanes yamanashiensis]